jgi:hypothetical protein
MFGSIPGDAIRHILVSVTKNIRWEWADELHKVFLSITLEVWRVEGKGAKFIPVFN